MNVMLFGHLSSWTPSATAFFQRKDMNVMLFGHLSSWTPSAAAFFQRKDMNVMLFGHLLNFAAVCHAVTCAVCALVS
jgi:hypothetical protein